MYTTSAADDKICDIGAGDEYPCTCTGDPCTDFTVGGTKVYPTYKYYGYFNPDYWYTYGGSKFTPTAPKTDSGITGARARMLQNGTGIFELAYHEKAGYYKKGHDWRKNHRHWRQLPGFWRR